MDTESPDLADLAILRGAFEDGTPLGWEAVYAFEAQHGIVLPEPYRTFVAEITGGAAPGPPDHGLVGLGRLPDDWGDNRPVRSLAEPFPLTAARVWEDEDTPDEELARCWSRSTTSAPPPGAPGSPAGSSTGRRTRTGTTRSDLQP